MVHFYCLFWFVSLAEEGKTPRLTDANFECLPYFLLLLLLFSKDIFLSSFTINNAAKPKMYILHFYSCSFLSLLGSHPFRGTCHIHGCLSVTRFWPSYRCHIHNKIFSQISYQIASFLLFDTFSHPAPRQNITHAAASQFFCLSVLLSGSSVLFPFTLFAFLFLWTVRNGWLTGRDRLTDR